MPGRLLNLTAPINRNHPLNYGLITCIEPTPTMLGGVKLRDLCRLDDAAIESGTTWRLAAPPNGLAALNFSASNINFPSSVVSRFSKRNQFTVGLWIYPTSLVTYKAIFDTTSRHCSFFLNSATDGYFGCGGGAAGMTFPAGLLVANKWQWLLLTYSAGPGLVFAYLNGQQLGSATIATSTAFSDPLVFGTNESGGGTDYQGMQSSWRIWNRYFTPSDAYKMYLEARAGFPETLNYHPRSIVTTTAQPYSATGFITLGAMTLSGSATFSPGVHTATGAIVLGAMTLSGSATFGPGTKTASGTLSVAPMTLSGSGIHGYYSFGTIIVAPMTLAGSATFAPGTKTATGTLAVAPMVLSGSASAPMFSTGTLVVAAMTVGSDAAFVPMHESDPSTQGFAGRYRRGESFPLMFETNVPPDNAPIVDFWHEATTKVWTTKLSNQEPTHTIFTRRQHLGAEFIDGHYVVTIRYEIAGSPGPTQHLRTFEVVGGEPTGASIAIIELRRALGTAVVMQTEDGRVSMGYSPRIGIDQE